MGTDVRIGFMGDPLDGTEFSWFNVRSLATWKHICQRAKCVAWCSHRKVWVCVL